VNLFYIETIMTLMMLQADSDHFFKIFSNVDEAGRGTTVGWGRMGGSYQAGSAQWQAGT